MDKGFRGQRVIVGLTLFTSLLLVTLQPNVNPIVIEALRKAGYPTGSDFLPLWQHACFPYHPFDLVIVLGYFVLLSLCCWCVFRLNVSSHLKALFFGVAYCLMNCLLLVFYHDPFVLVHGAASALMLALVVHHNHNPSPSLDSSTPEQATAYIQESVETLRQTMNLSITMAIAIGVSILALNYELMEKKFAVAGQGNYETALWNAQGSQAALCLWNSALFVCIYLPALSTRIRLLTEKILVLRKGEC